MPDDVSYPQAPTPTTTPQVPPQGGPRYYAQMPAVTGLGAVGRVRGTGVCILLSVVTLGIYSLFWYYNVHAEMKRHTGTGLGGGLALLITVIFGIAMPFVTASEVGQLYARRGQPQPVSGVTGLWLLLPFVGGLVWFVKTNGALNAYWRSLGAA